MALKDAVYTGLTVAEARGKPWLAGTLDALGDLASIFVMVVGAGAVIQNGLGGRTLVVLAAMTVTSFFGTVLWTYLSDRWIKDD